MNPAASEMIGYRPAEVVGRNLHELSTTPVDGAASGESSARPRRPHRPRAATARQRRLLAQERHADPDRCTSTPIIEGDESVGAVLIVSDISDQLRLEDAVRQAQKMEAVGQLAGGVAHDFNNLLTAIVGYTELALTQRPRRDDPLLRERLEEIRRRADRAAALTRQLLAFSRKQVLQPKVLDLNDRRRDTGGAAGRLIGEDIELSSRARPEARARSRPTPGRSSRSS